MPYDRFLIAPFKTGLVTEIKAWMIPEDAFAKLENAYIHKGVVRKRFGSILSGAAVGIPRNAQLNSRLRILINTTDGAGHAAGVVPGATFGMGQMFNIGDEIFTVATLGAPVNMLRVGGVGLGTYNTTTGAYVFNFCLANTPIYFYPAQPVMGITRYETNDPATSPSYAFDTQFIYRFNGAAWNRDGTLVFHGGDSDFFYTCNWTGITPGLIAMFVTNFNATVGAPAAGDDPMYTYKNGAWTEFRPVIKVIANVVDDYVQTARIIIPFKDRLLLLNTIERNVTTGLNTQYQNRCRFSHNGSPFPADVPNNVAAAVSNAWLAPKETWTIGAVTKLYNGAGYIDAPTSEEIFAAEFIKDRLIIYFERSTYELAYTGNQILPFVWQKINTEMGSRSLKSVVPFDKAIFAVGRTEIHGCTGANVTKIDDKIGDQTFEIRNANYGLERISGIRDYELEMIYWAYPSTGANIFSQTFPNKVFIYNYTDDAWGQADDTITAFGYFSNNPAMTWANNQMNWGGANFQWDNGVAQLQYRQILAGNQQGFVFMCIPDVSTNAAVMQVTDIFTLNQVVRCIIMNHTLNTGDYIKITNIAPAVLTGTGIYDVWVIDANTVVLGGATLIGVYPGGGSAARVSQIDILTKQFNLYVDKGKNCYLAKISFAVQATAFGEIVVDCAPSSSDTSMIGDATVTNSLLGTNVLETHPYDLFLCPLEERQRRLWHDIYFQTEGECIQINMYLNDNQMKNAEIVESDFRMEGLILHARSTSERLQ
jgi:hypothetical protein